MASSLSPSYDSELPDLRTRDDIQGLLRGLARQLKVSEDSEALAAKLDELDQLSHLRTCSNVPTVGSLLGKTDKDTVENGKDQSQAT